MKFSINQQLATDTFKVCSLPLNEVRLMNDSRFPWIILVPRIPDLRDFHEIPTQHRDSLFQEIEMISTVIKRLWTIDKMNVAALGNQVSQLHVHVIGRRNDDKAWPNPVWGFGTPQPYPEALKLRTLQSLTTELELSD